MKLCEAVCILQSSLAAVRPDATDWVMFRLGKPEEIWVDWGNGPQFVRTEPGVPNRPWLPDANDFWINDWQVRLVRREDG